MLEIENLFMDAKWTWTSNGPVYSASVSPDGTRIVTASGNNARILDLKTGAEIETLPGNGGPVYSASFSPDGSRVLMVSSPRAPK
jgi:WD40 repeat protein